MGGSTNEWGFGQFGDPTHRLDSVSLAISYLEEYFPK